MTTHSDRPGLSEFVAAADRAVLAFDFDGTLAPIVDDPASARIHPHAPSLLLRLATVVPTIAVVTGRPAHQALAMGDLLTLATSLEASGCQLMVFGQYGNERWSTSDPRVSSPPPPAGLAAFERELPRVLSQADAPGAFVEEKGLAVAVHTRRLADPADALDRLTSPITELARQYGLSVEPGRNVIEVRAPGVHKGDAIRTLVVERSPSAFFFAGDDLGDLEAFAAVEQLRGEGMPTVLVCSASTEQPALEHRADVVVDGPDGLVGLLEEMAGKLGV